jgi:hypothetical protein
LSVTWRFPSERVMTPTDPAMPGPALGVPVAIRGGQTAAHPPRHAAVLDPAVSRSKVYVVRPLSPTTAEPTLVAPTTTTNAPAAVAPPEVAPPAVAPATVADGAAGAAVVLGVLVLVATGAAARDDVEALLPHAARATRPAAASNAPTPRATVGAPISAICLAIDIRSREHVRGPIPRCSGMYGWEGVSVRRRDQLDDRERHVATRQGRGARSPAPSPGPWTAGIGGSVAPCVSV